MNPGSRISLMKYFFQKLTDQAKKVNWTLLLFLLLLLNVKLVIKILAFLFIAVSEYRKFSLKELRRQKHLLFYLSLIAIAIINYLVQPKNGGINQALAAALGIMLWVICLASGYYLSRIVQKEQQGRLFNTIAVFFVLHTATCFVNLLAIMIRCGTFNPYTYKGFNQQYYISTGDFISGISFDSPVTTAMISAMAVIYFLYRRQFILSLAAMPGLLIIASNLTNIMLVLVLLFVFISRSDKLQKSIIIVQLFLLVIFTARISPQNNEYTGRFVYKMLGLTYDLPKHSVSADLLKKQPDSLLTAEEIKKKKALLFIDSVSTLKAGYNLAHGLAPAVENDLPDKQVLLGKDSQVVNSSFFQYQESEKVAGKVTKYSGFLLANFQAATRDSLQKKYNWSKPGKWTALLQIIDFFKEHPGKLLTGAGTGHFSSRVAFKTTSMGIAGGYPSEYRYIHPSFLHNHLYLYIYFHSQEQPKHAAENTPDSTYGQLISEYGLAGIFAFLLFYAGYFLRSCRQLTFGLPVLVLLLGAFCIEYWFEQLSVVILFELLLLTDKKTSNTESMRREGQSI